MKRGSFKYYTLAADNGNTIVCIVPDCYYNGVGVKQITEAYRWFTDAAGMEILLRLLSR